MTPRPSARKTKALPPLYVVVDGDGYVWTASASSVKALAYVKWSNRCGTVKCPQDGDRIVEYVPSSPRRARRK